MGALAVPLSHLFGPDALEYRLGDSGAHLAIVDAARCRNCWHCATVAAVAARDRRWRSARQGRQAWAEVLEHASVRYTPALTAADDAAMIIYTSGTTGKPKGALMAHRTLLGNLSGYVCSHDFFPQPATCSGRRPTGRGPAVCGMCSGADLALRNAPARLQGRFDAGKAFALIEKYGIRNSFLFPTALKMMMKAVPDPRRSTISICAAS
jgi:acetyl-CoA synthetase